MKEYKELKPLLAQIIRYIGNGYKYIQVSKIPKNKAHKRANIIDKLNKKYDLNLTTWQRQYKRRKGRANFVGLLYQDTIILLKTEGTTNKNIIGFKSIKTAQISFNYLSLVLFIDERGKWTYRLNRSTLRDFKIKLELALKNKKGREFHNIIKRLYTLHKIVRYRGVMLQISSILKDLKELQKKYNTNYHIPKFF